jgi:hypothetical protein
MPSIHLKRAEQKVAAMREQQELPPKAAAETIEELVEAIRAVERRLAIVERRVPAHPPKWPTDAL